MWATRWRCPHFHRPGAHRAVDRSFCGDRRVRRAHYGAVRTCRIGKAGTAPTSTAKSRIGTVPHTVPGTHAGAVFHPLRTWSTCRRARTDPNACPAVSVWALPRSGAHLQPLRPRPDLLCRRMCAGRPAPRATCGRPALPDEPPGPPGPCLACPSLSRPTKERDASGFPAASRG
jgi:hypothetical protein